MRYMQLQTRNIYMFRDLSVRKNLRSHKQRHNRGVQLVPMIRYMNNLIGLCLCLCLHTSLVQMYTPIQQEGYKALAWVLALSTRCLAGETHCKNNQTESSRSQASHRNLLLMMCIPIPAGDYRLGQSCKLVVFRSHTILLLACRHLADTRNLHRIHNR